MDALDLAVEERVRVERDGPASTLVPEFCVLPGVLPPPPTDSRSRPSLFCTFARGLSPLPPTPLNEASAAPICATCSAESCEALWPNSRRARISSCGSGGLLLSSNCGASAKPVISSWSS